MTSRKYRETVSLINRLLACQEVADKYDIRLGNGGEVGSLIGTIATELALSIEPHSKQSTGSFAGD